MGEEFVDGDVLGARPIELQTECEATAFRKKPRRAKSRSTRLVLCQAMIDVAG